MSTKIYFESYDNNEDVNKEIDVTKIKSVSFSYDGGRLHVYVNDEEVIEEMGAGNDIYVSIELNPIK